MEVNKAAYLFIALVYVYTQGARQCHGRLGGTAQLDDL